MMLNPAYAQWKQADAQWQQAALAAQQVQQSNQQKQQQFDQAVALIKQDGVHGFRIDIEADSTIAPDEQAEKSARVEFMEKFVPFMQQIVPMAQGNPAGANMAEQITLFVMRGFRVARPLEETVTKFFDTMAKMPPPQPPQGAGADSPADLALRNKEDNTKLTIAREKNSIEMAKLGELTSSNSAKNAAAETEARTKAALDAEREAGEERFRQTRAASLQSRGASHLT